MANRIPYDLNEEIAKSLTDMPKYQLTVSDILIPHELIPAFLRPLIRFPVCGLTVEELVDKVFESGTLSIDVEDALVYSMLISWSHPFHFRGRRHEVTCSIKACKEIAHVTRNKICKFYFDHSAERAWNFIVRRNLVGYPGMPHHDYRHIEDRCDIMWYDSVEDIMRDDVMVGHIINLASGLDTIRRWEHGFAE